VKTEVRVSSRSCGIVEKQIIGGRITLDLSALRFSRDIETELVAGRGLFHRPRCTMEFSDLSFGIDRAVHVRDYNALESTAAIGEKPKIRCRRERVGVAAGIHHLVESGDTAS
jgi:hypothetical protein